MNTVKKNMTAGAGSYAYKYSDLAQIHAYLEENKMSYWQYIEPVDGVDFIYTVPVINGEEKAPRRGCKVVNATLHGKSNPVQEYGAALTYARRYSLLMAFGLATEDDDAESLSVEEKASEAQLTVLRRAYTGDNFKKLLEVNNLEKLEDISKAKASELISKIYERNEKNNAQ